MTATVTITAATVTAASAIATSTSISTTTAIPLPRTTTSTNIRFKEGLLSSFARLLGLKSVGFVVNLGAKEVRNRFGVTWGSCNVA